MADYPPLERIGPTLKQSVCVEPGLPAANQAQKGQAHGECEVRSNCENTTRHHQDSPRLTLARSSCAMVLFGSVQLLILP